MNTTFCRKPFHFLAAPACLILFWGIQQSFGQWVTQSITLNPGWNAVFLEVQPGNADPDFVFSSVPVESVWAWNRHYSSVQFIQDPSQLVPGQPDWLTYLAPDHPARVTRNLFALQGGRAYLIKLKSGSSTVIWNILGQPVVRQTDWLSDSLNFVGFSLSTGATTTFQDFFSGSPAQSGQPAYQLNAAGQWVLISNPAGTLLQRGHAYWVFCKGASTFSGPVQITLEQWGGLNYGRLATEQTVRLKNSSASVRTVTVQEIASAQPGDTNSPVLAGTVPLSYYMVDATNRIFGWFPLTAPLQRINMQPGEEWVLRLEVNRTSMAAFTPPPGNNGVLYQSVLRIVDDTGAGGLVPVSSEGLTGSSAQVRLGPALKDGQADPHAGLWVGHATITGVSQPASSSSTASNTPTPVSAPLQFRLLVHVDTNGNARLLQKVLEMFKPGTVKPDPNNPSNNIVDPPGHYVLITDDSLISSFSGATLVDGQLVGRRLSSAAFGFSQPILLSSTGAFGTGTFAGQVNLDYDDRLNPFKHVYHPDHDNLDDRFQNKLPEGVESFSVLRQIEFDFTAQDPDNSTLPGWGDDQLGGIYKEAISGLHSQLIYISGTFRLTRASTIGVLNDGL